MTTPTSSTPEAAGEGESELETRLKVAGWPKKFLILAGQVWRWGNDISRHHKRHEEREGIIAQIVVLSVAIGGTALLLALAVLSLLIVVPYRIFHRPSRAIPR